MAKANTIYSWKEKVVNTKALEYAKRIRIVYREYVANDNLCVMLYTMGHEPYCDITKYIVPLKADLGYVEANSEAERFVIEQDIGENQNRPIQSGFNTYNLYKFNLE